MIHQKECRSVSYSADGRYLASAGFDSKVIISDTSYNELKIVKNFQHDDKALSVRWHP
jgi:WD40 repeat protein